MGKITPNSRNRKTAEKKKKNCYQHLNNAAVFTRGMFAITDYLEGSLTAHDVIKPRLLQSQLSQVVASGSVL